MVSYKTTGRDSGGHQFNFGLQRQRVVIIVKMRLIALVLATCFLGVLTQDSYDNAGVRIALKVLEDCAAADALTSCLKNKAITVVDRLGKMDKFSLMEGITIIRSSDAKNDAAVNENKVEDTGARSSSTSDDLNTQLLDKVSKFISSRSIEVTMPKLSIDDFVEGRKGDLGGGGGHGGGHGGGGHGGGKGGKKGGMMGGLMMAIAAKMAALVPIAIAGLFLLAGKALITAKIALLLSGIIAIKKLVAAKQGGGTTTHSVGWQSGGHGGGGGGGWQSGGGGWDKRSLEDAQLLAYNAHSPK